jgi:hypothetical protein
VCSPENEQMMETMVYNRKRRPKNVLVISPDNEETSGQSGGRAREFRGRKQRHVDGESCREAQ